MHWLTILLGINPRYTVLYMPLLEKNSLQLREKKKITFNLCSNSSVLISFVLWLKEPDFTPLINKADCLISIILFCVYLSIAELCSFVICKLSLILNFVTIILCKLLNANIVILSVKSAKLRIKIKKNLKGKEEETTWKNKTN